MKILSIMLLLFLLSCGRTKSFCVQNTMFLNFDVNRPTGITAEQAMKICEVK